MNIVEISEHYSLESVFVPPVSIAITNPIHPVTIIEIITIKTVVNITSVEQVQKLLLELFKNSQRSKFEKSENYHFRNYSKSRGC